MEPLRILHVIGSLNNGGSQAMIMNVYENIDRSKVQFDFIIDRPDEVAYGKRIKELGGKIYTMPQFTMKNIYIFINAWKKFFVNHPEYKIVHGHVRSTASIYLNIAKKYGLKTIAHSHNTSSGTGLSAIIKNLLQYQIRNISDYFLACSRPAGEWLFGKEVCSSKNFFILNNAIDTSKFIYDEDKRLIKREEFNIENKVVIGHIGRFHSQKNHDFLIDIFKEIHGINTNTVLMLIGDGELYQSIFKKVNDYGLTDNVIFTGVRSDIHELLQAMDVFVFPSLYEGLGMVAVEAQAAGLPCIVSDVIPREAHVTNLVKSISLKEPANIWAEEILNSTKGHMKHDTSNQIKSMGYDVKENAEWLEEFYYGLYK